jgi:hypothetical protein
MAAVTEDEMITDKSKQRDKKAKRKNILSDLCSLNLPNKKEKGKKAIKDPLAEFMAEQLAKKKRAKLIEKS